MKVVACRFQKTDVQKETEVTLNLDKGKLSTSAIP